LAAALKNQFGVDIPGKIAAMISLAAPDFEKNSFLRDALQGYEALELLARGKKIAVALRRHLPKPFEEAVEILIKTLGPPLEETENLGMSPFLYLPHVCFVAEFGLEDFEASMRAQYELTQRFSAEFSIRPFLERHTDATLARLRTWATDASPHVRRLVSEGTRPRLPWASRLRMFQKDPRPVLELLEILKDDPELYVRRSVANNLNDIGKDHPSLLVDTARRWLRDATAERRWIVNHALRSAIKRAEPGALKVLGFGGEAKVALRKVSITPRRPAIGRSVTVAFDVVNTAEKSQQIVADLRIHFIKSNGKISPKVFKLNAANIAAGETLSLRKAISLAQLTTRKHYPGTHRVEVVINGKTRRLGNFALRR
jgi:3-methyladenine DNA glycosylase AlkC